jgi:CheY-like chemotaxis protein
MKLIHTPEILAIEDNEADTSLLKVLFSSSGMNVNLHFAKSGMEGADFIFAREEFTNRPVPDLILMDLNIPLKDGRELMKEIKSNVELCRIPIIILSTTNNELEIADSYLCGATAFITKPSSLDQFQETINTLCNFWFGCATLPRHPESRHTSSNYPTRAVL